MIEFMPYLGWLLCGFVAGSFFGAFSVVTFAVWWSRVQPAQKKVQKDQAVNLPPYYNSPN